MVSSFKKELHGRFSRLRQYLDLRMMAGPHPSGPVGSTIQPRPQRSPAQEVYFLGLKILLRKVVLMTRPSSAISVSIASIRTRGVAVSAGRSWKMVQSGRLSKQSWGDFRVDFDTSFLCEHGRALSFFTESGCKKNHTPTRN